MKTGALIEACFFIPALLKQAPTDQVNQLRDIGLKTGLLFQIIDDILDVKGSSEELGGKRGENDPLQNTPVRRSQRIGRP